MTDSQTRKTPAEFIAAADVFNAELAALMRTQADAALAVQGQMQARETLIAAAKDYGLTGSYARTLLRKA